MPGAERRSAVVISEVPLDAAMAGYPQGHRLQVPLQHPHLQPPGVPEEDRPASASVRGTGSSLLICPNESWTSRLRWCMVRPEEPNCRSCPRRSSIQS